MWPGAANFGLAMAPSTDSTRRRTAFVSYAQSSSEWQARVLRFTTALRMIGGVDAELDLYHDTDHQQWTRFGSGLIESSDFTLIAIDAAYKRRWLGTERKGVGAGAAREAAAIRAIFERDQEEFVARVKVVVLPGAGEGDIPDELLGLCERFSVPVFDENGLEKLLRTIWNRPVAEKPPLGDIPTLPPRFLAKLEGEDPAPAGPPPAPRATESASVADERDEVALRDQLGRVIADLDKRSMEETERRDLRREVAALQTSLDALAQARVERRRRGGRLAPRSRGSKVLLAAGAAVLLGATALALVLADSGSSEQGSSVHAATAGIELQGPPGWRVRDGEARPLLGLGIGDPVSLVSPAGGERSEYAVAGVSSSAAGPTLLPAAYRSQLGGDASREAVDVGSLQAYRYTGLADPGSGERLTVFAAPTSLGVATLVCGADGNQHGEADTCARIASTLRLARGSAYPLGPSPSFSRALGKWLARISQRRAKSAGEMAAAADADGQAEAAHSLAETFGNAAAGLRRLEITPESATDRSAIAAAMGSARDAYEDVASAARAEDKAGYAAAKGKARQSEAELNARLENLAKLGYEVSGIPKS